MRFAGIWKWQIFYDAYNWIRNIIAFGNADSKNRQITNRLHSIWLIGIRALIRCMVFLKCAIK